MASSCRNTLAWRLLLLVLLASVVSANLRELKELMRRVDSTLVDDDDFFIDRQLHGSGSGGGGSGSGNSTPQPEPEVCDDEALAAKCGGVCGRAHCRDYPTATCRPRHCDDCTPVWSVNGREIANCTGRPLQCPGVWTLKGSHCYRVQNRYGFNFKLAQKYCLRQGGHLVSINSETEQNLVSSLLLLDKEAYWTSGYKQPESGSWVWQQADGDHPMTWTYWNYREPNTWSRDRVSLKKSGHLWKWHDETSVIKLYPICEAAPEKILSHCDSKPCMNGGLCTTVSQDMYRCECGKFYSGKYCELYNDNSMWNHHNGHLYLVVSDYSFNRQDASAYCAMHNAYLVSINTQEESDFIKGLLDKRGLRDITHSFYTGGYKAYVNSFRTVQWADGTAVGFHDFTDWGYGEPNDYAGIERYIMLKYNIGNNKWEWNDTPGTWLGGFICEKQAMTDSRRNLQASYNTGMLQRLFAKKWTQPDSTMEY